MPDPTLSELAERQMEVDRAIMGSAEDAEIALAEAASEWRAYRQPIMATAKALRERDAAEREARFRLANAALHWLWHRENPALIHGTTAPAGEEGR